MAEEMAEEKLIILRAEKFRGVEVPGIIVQIRTDMEQLWLTEYESQQNDILNEIVLTNEEAYQLLGFLSCNIKDPSPIY